jgi:hypothetical protein
MSQREKRSTRIPRADILDLGEYERRRDQIRPGAITARAMRRVDLGPNATLAFENRETVTYQIHEMLRAERIAKEPDVELEIITYNELLPSSEELSATLMFEFSEADARSVHLRDLVGFENHLHIDFGPAGRSTAHFDIRQLDSDQISAVQFVRFLLNEVQRKALAHGEGVRIVADHPRYAHAAVLPAPTCRALAADMQEASTLETADV